MGVNFDNIGSKMGQAVDNVEQGLTDQINGFDAENASQADMIALQMSMQKWSMATQLQSNVMKTIGEGLKSIVSNMR